MKRSRPNRVVGAELAAGVLVGLVAFELIGALVSDLIAPLIAVFIGDARFELNAFVIEGSEFRYGQFLETAFIAAISGLVLMWLWSDHGRRYWRRLDQQDGDRECPECTSPISAKASRCPYCTSQLSTGDSSV
jgi:large conductance mechanosensitive channel